jgi:hypothetical protein
MLGMHLRKRGLSEQAVLVCRRCNVGKPCLTVAFCSKCDGNFCASPRPEESASFFGARCFELHSAACPNATPKFPLMLCGDMDWSQLGDDGKFPGSSTAVVRELLEKKLKAERMWQTEYKKLKKPELLKKVLESVRRN